MSKVHRHRFFFAWHFANVMFFNLSAGARGAHCRGVALGSEFGSHASALPAPRQLLSKVWIMGIYNLTGSSRVIGKQIKSDVGCP